MISKTMFTIPYEDWYHCTEHTYGSWLRGDPRGWRARHHREHVEGDYKNPPPKGTYDRLLEYSKSLMKRDPVRVAPNRREFVLLAVMDKLREKGIEVLVASLDGTHLHALTRCPDRNPRHWMGLAKKNASHMVRSLPDYEPGGLWAKRGLEKPIADHDHLINARDYIADHKDRGAAVWIADQII